MTTYRDTDYATSDELKGYERVDDTIDDDSIALAITAASRAIDKATGRSFGLDSTAVTRIYPSSGGIATVNDIPTTTGLVVKFSDALDFSPTFDETLTIGQDFRLLPLNSEADAQPWTHIEVNRKHYRRHFTLQVTATFGWLAIPDTVKQAVLIQASRFLKRRDAPFGIAGSPELGSELRLLAQVDPDVAVMLSGYTRRWAGV